MLGNEEVEKTTAKNPHNNTRGGEVKLEGELKEKKCIQGYRPNISWLLTS